MHLDRIMLLLGLLAAQSQAVAQSDVHPYLTDDVVIFVGGFFPRLDFKLEVDGSLGGENKSIDFDRQLDLPAHDDIFDIELNWRFGEKWSLRSQYFSGGRSGSSVLDEDVEWGDVVFEQGSGVTGRTELQIIRAFFGRAFETKSNVDAGIGIGLHHLDLGASITGTLIVNGMELGGQKRSVSTNAILPNIGGWYSWSPAEKWALITRVDWLEASVGDLRGGILNMAAGVNYQLFDHIGVGISYQNFSLRLRSHEDNWTGRAKLGYRGAYLYLTGNW